MGKEVPFISDADRNSDINPYLRDRKEREEQNEDEEDIDDNSKR